MLNACTLKPRLAGAKRKGIWEIIYMASGCFRMLQDTCICADGLHALSGLKAAVQYLSIGIHSQVLGRLVGHAHLEWRAVELYPHILGYQLRLHHILVAFGSPPQLVLRHVDCCSPRQPSSVMQLSRLRACWESRLQQNWRH